MKLNISDLRKSLQSELVNPHELKPLNGIPTGLKELDLFLPWKGLPKSQLSLFHGFKGLGATSLWTQMAIELTKKEKWVAWINGSSMERNFQIYPLPLWQKDCNLAKVFVVSIPACEKKFYWALQEIISSHIFDLIGCHVDFYIPPNFRLLKIQKVLKKYHSSCVFISSRSSWPNYSLYSLALQFQNSQICIQKSLHRPTPTFIQRSNTYEDIMSQLPQTHRRLNG